MAQVTPATQIERRDLALVSDASEDAAPSTAPSSVSTQTGWPISSIPSVPYGRCEWEVPIALRDMRRRRMHHKHHAVRRKRTGSHRLIGCPERPRMRCLAGSRIALGAFFLVRTTHFATFELSFRTHTWPMLGWQRVWGAGKAAAPSGCRDRFGMRGRTLRAACFLLGVRRGFRAALGRGAWILVMLADPSAPRSHWHLPFQGAIVLALFDSGGGGRAFADRGADAPRSTSSGSIFPGLLIFGRHRRTATRMGRGRTVALFQATARFTDGPTSHFSTPVSRSLAHVVAVIELSSNGPAALAPHRRLGLALASLCTPNRARARPDLLGWEMQQYAALWPSVLIE